MSDQENFTAVAANGTEFAAIASAIPNSDAVIFTALEDRRTESAIEELITTYRLTGAALIVAFAGLSIAVVGLGLRPLRRLTAAASSITSNGTGSRMPPGRPGTEVGDLSDALNQMIDELHGMARSTRTFAADAAHELRTPVTTIIGYAELYHNGMLSDPDRIDSAFTRISHEARRLSALSEGLLLMNQIELRSLHQMTEPPAQPFDLRELCAEAAADAMTVNSAYPISLDGPTGVLITAHRDRIQQVITNLLNNVRQHTPSGTLTTIEIRVRDTTVEMVVANTGRGCPMRFWTTLLRDFSQGGRGWDGLRCWSWHRVRDGLAERDLGLPLSEPWWKPADLWPSHHRDFERRRGHRGDPDHIGADKPALSVRGPVKAGMPGASPPAIWVCSAGDPCDQRAIQGHPGEPLGLRLWAAPRWSSWLPPVRW